MHDPITVAHEIKWPFKNKKGHQKLILTIWHVDPERHALGCRDDDSCGWFSPPYTAQESERVRELAKDQYGQLFARKEALRQEKDYANICYNQDIYGAIYWSWRALKAMGKKGWQYGERPSVKEIDAIYCLATNPADNMQSRKINNVEDFTDFLFTVWRVFRKFHRPWYKHPRWHIHHWKIQFHPWQNFRRRYLDKCCICGKRGFKSSPMSDWDGTKRWHQECDRSVVKQPDNNYKIEDIGKRAIAHGHNQAGKIIKIKPHETETSANADYVTIDTGLTLHRHYFWIEGDDGIFGQLFEEHKNEFFK